jgi:hypothetical protein
MKLDGGYRPPWTGVVVLQLLVTNGSAASGTYRGFDWPRVTLRAGKQFMEKYCNQPSSAIYLEFLTHQVQTLSALTSTYRVFWLASRSSLKHN